MTTCIIHHLHLKCSDPRASADWFVAALGFAIVSDETLPDGNRFVRCNAGKPPLRIVFSGERHGESLPSAIDGPHLGIEHIGFASADVPLDAAHLVSLGARLDAGPMIGQSGERIAFLTVPGGFRIELVEAMPPRQR